MQWAVVIWLFSWSLSCFSAPRRRRKSTRKPSWRIQNSTEVYQVIIKWRLLWFETWHKKFFSSVSEWLEALMGFWYQQKENTTLFTIQNLSFIQRKGKFVVCEILLLVSVTERGADLFHARKVSGNKTWGARQIYHSTNKYLLNACRLSADLTH